MAFLGVLAMEKQGGISSVNTNALPTFSQIKLAYFTAMSTNEKPAFSIQLAENPSTMFIGGYLGNLDEAPDIVRSGSIEIQCKAASLILEDVVCVLHHKNSKNRLQTKLSDQNGIVKFDELVVGMGEYRVTLYADGYNALTYENLTAV